MLDPRSANRSMFWRVLRRSVFANRGRLFVILLALGAGAAITAALLNLQVDAKRRITTEFRSFGPNVLVSPKLAESGGTLDHDAVNAVVPWKPFDGYFGTPFLYTIATITTSEDGAKMKSVIVGTRLDLLSAAREGKYWKTVEVFPEYVPGGCFVGVNLGKRLQLRAGNVVQMSLGENLEKCTVTGIFESGSSEDSQVFVTLELAQRLARMPGRISLAKVNVVGTPSEIEKTIVDLQRKLPFADIRPIRQFTEGEARLYGKISGTLTATVVVVLVLTALCVMAAMTNVAMERKNDVGLMKAIGGSVRRVLRLFLAEAALLGLAGGLIGAAVGIVISIGLGKAVFGVAAQPRLIVYPVSVALTVIVAILAAFPLRRLVHIRPASVFRGEE